MLCFRLIESLEEKGHKANEDLAYIERIQAQIEGLSSELNGLQSETERLYVFGEDQKAAEDSLNVCKYIFYVYVNCWLQYENVITLIINING